MRKSRGLGGFGQPSLCVELPDGSGIEIFVVILGYQMGKFDTDGVSGYVQTRLLPDIILSAMPRLQSLNSMSNLYGKKQGSEKVDDTSRPV